jgi:biopolymer transport protein TolQ
MVNPAESVTILNLVMEADPIVKGVMAALLVASLWSWSVAIDKWLQFGELATRAKTFEKAFWASHSIRDLDDRGVEQARDAFARVFAAGAREWRDSVRQSHTPETINLVQDRCDRLMNAQIQRELAVAGRGLSVLATIGATTPFIGLLGTVWGIMNSFTAIAAQQQTNLAVVAPGIAEALFATALGLAVAIPAVIFYNKFSGDLDRFADRLESFAEEVGARLSRRLSERL